MSVCNFSYELVSVSRIFFQSLHQRDGNYKYLNGNDKNLNYDEQFLYAYQQTRHGEEYISKLDSRSVEIQIEK